MIIDAWAQHPTLRHIQDPIFDSLRRWSKAAVPEKDIPVAATIAAMDRANVDLSLISGWVAPRNVMISNDEIASFVAEYPDRLVGVGSVDIYRPMEAVGEIRRCIKTLGFKAIRVLPWLWGVPPTDRLFYPVYTANRYPKALVEYLKTYGRTKILFGTNYPMIEPAKALEDGVN